MHIWPQHICRAMYNFFIELFTISWMKVWGNFHRIWITMENILWKTAHQFYHTSRSCLAKCPDAPISQLYLQSSAAYLFTYCVYIFNLGWIDISLWLRKTIWVWLDSTAYIQYIPYSRAECHRVFLLLIPWEKYFIMMVEIVNGHSIHICDEVVLVQQLWTCLDVSTFGQYLWILDWTCYPRTLSCHV